MARHQPGVVEQPLAQPTWPSFGNRKSAAAVTRVDDGNWNSFWSIYKEKIGYDASFYNVTLGDGVKEIENFSL